MKQLAKVSSIAALALCAVAAQAQQAPSLTDRAQAREDRQAKRIEAGVASGKISPEEAARLAKGQSRIDSMEQKMGADGQVTGKEKARLHQAQDKQSQRIAGAAHKPGDRSRPQRQKPAGQ